MGDTAAAFLSQTLLRIFLCQHDDVEALLPYPDRPGGRISHDAVSE